MSEKNIFRPWHFGSRARENGSVAAGLNIDAPTLERIEGFLFIHSFCYVLPTVLLSNITLLSIF